MTGRTAIVLDGDDLARRIRGELANEARALRDAGIVPTLATVLVGDNPASRAYVARKHADCREVGIESRELNLPANTSRTELLSVIRRLNDDPAVHGFLVQFPLPEGLDEGEAASSILPTKDIDGLHPYNLGRLLAGTPTVLPCTPAGVLALLESWDIRLSGKRVLVIGRGTLVGRPLAMLLSLRGVDATVTLAHRRTPDLAELARQSDVIISAAGVPDLVTRDMVKPGAAVVGVGITYDADGQLVSDIADDVAAVAGWKTPRHGSVGALTRAFLLANLLQLASGR
ncbi:bifunctional methylenetetrahydrofolate dehydrogenase/methenyltetrahydrofolate cyclohydrolase [Chelativorans composti]|jgi:5,10-methylene-tetrahydrofolate dehydrogenase/Methenyl tetrahydrofolate cyclohydrolase|uniref:Bifunctional protein FolD n=1 Tax=Chelativorans composti TaxID=768533 RepID=A0ABW5DG08_9HYPH|nr:bifunctional methylenetetrahydrofolate dehydrogenase/methenyltetrahydrofolate cyclohydrolase [bacterium SGD-2]